MFLCDKESNETNWKPSVTKKQKLKLSECLFEYKSLQRNTSEANSETLLTAVIPLELMTI